jgi:RNA polymerase sigma-70 factor (family 1)
MEYSSRADADLYLLFKSGDVQGFNTLFNRHWIGLFRVAKKILDDDELAKDAVQETFLSLYERDSAVDINHIRAYLFQSVKYQCFMQLRSGRISEKHLARLQTVMSFNNIEEEMDARELQTMLNFEIESLPEKCRQVFCLSRFEMLSNKKIAERLNISQKTVEHQITKALKTLRISLDKMAIFVWVLIS